MAQNTHILPADARSPTRRLILRDDEERSTQRLWKSVPMTLYPPPAAPASEPAPITVHFSHTSHLLRPASHINTIAQLFLHAQAAGAANANCALVQGLQVTIAGQTAMVRRDDQVGFREMVLGRAISAVEAARKQAPGEERSEAEVVISVGVRGLASR